MHGVVVETTGVGVCGSGVVGLEGLEVGVGPSVVSVYNGVVVENTVVVVVGSVDVALVVVMLIVVDGVVDGTVEQVIFECMTVLLMQMA